MYEDYDIFMRTTHQLGYNKIRLGGSITRNNFICPADYIMLCQENNISINNKYISINISIISVNLIRLRQSLTKAKDFCGKNYTSNVVLVVYIGKLITKSAGDLLCLNIAVSQSFYCTA